MNFRDVQIGPLDPGLFEAPRGVRIVRVNSGDLATLVEGMAAAGQLGFGRRPAVNGARAPARCRPEQGDAEQLREWPIPFERASDP